MERRELLRIKQLPKHGPKQMGEVQFRPCRRGSLPKPLDKIGGPRISATKVIQVSRDLCIVFLARTGETLDRRAFYGYLFQETHRGLLPLAILHYHPSHKGLHMLLNCEMNRDYTQRQLPGAPELAIKTPAGLDPTNARDQVHLVNIFCDRVGIRMGPDGSQLL